MQLCTAQLQPKLVPVATRYYTISIDCNCTITIGCNNTVSGYVRRPTGLTIQMYLPALMVRHAYTHTPRLQPRSSVVSAFARYKLMARHGQLSTRIIDPVHACMWRETHLQVRWIVIALRPI